VASLAKQSDIAGCCAASGHDAAAPRRKSGSSPCRLAEDLESRISILVLANGMQRTDEAIE
jgi:hypothetical protein